MANNRNRRTRTAPPKAREELSLLQQGANDARDAKDTLDQLVIEKTHADAAYFQAEAAFNEARRVRNLAGAKVEAQRSVYMSYLDQMAGMASSAINEVYPRPTDTCGYANACVPEGAIKSRY